MEIRTLEVLGFAPPLVELRVRCSKGTYIRALAEDIGGALGSGAHLAALRRTAAGGFRVEQALTLDELGPAARERLLPLASLLAGFPATQLDAASEARLRNGLPLQISGLQEGLCALYRADGAYQILLDEKSTSQLDSEIEVVSVDLLDEGDMVRHNTDRLARVVMSCAANARERNLIETELLAAN